MKKFHFSLSHVREYKNRLFEEEMGKLHQLRAQENEIEQRIENLSRNFQSISKRMMSAQRAGTTVFEIRSFSMQLENIRQQIKDLRQRLLIVQKQIEEQMQVVVAANQEVSKLDKLEERQLESYRQKTQKAEAERIEELVSQRFAATL